MSDNLTICTVCTGDEKLLNLNIDLVKNNNKFFNHNWIITQNFDPKKSLKNELINFNNTKVIKGNNKDEIGIASLNHGICLNRIIPIIKTRFVLFIDPDFFVLKKNWIEKLVVFMKKEKISILGVPWHPKWYMKYRFFPCNHFFMIDTNAIPLKELDFRPINLYFDDFSSNQNYSKNKKNNIIKQTLKKIFYNKKNNFLYQFQLFIKYNINIRKKIGWDGDTTSRIYLKYKNLKSVYLIKPVYEVEKQWILPISNKINSLIENFLPEKYCFIPKKNNYYCSYNKFSKLFIDYDFEGFVWNNEPFGFHIRGFPKDFIKNRNRNAEINLCKNIFDEYKKNFKEFI